MSDELEWTDIAEENERRKLVVHKGTGLYLDITFFRRAQSRIDADRAYLIGVLQEELLVAIEVNNALTKFASPQPSEDAARQ